MTATGSAVPLGQAAAGTQLPSLTSLRAVAALLVFGFHVGFFLEWAPAEQLLSHAYTGVGFFFVLSGFVLAWTSSGRSRGDFYWRRFARVYPSHLAMALLVTVLLVSRSDLSVPVLALNLTLLQAWVPSNTVAFGINGVSWSLSCEMFFYAVLPFLLPLLLRLTPARRLLVVGGWLLLCALATSASFVVPDLVAAFERVTGANYSVIAEANPLVRSGEFLLGVVAALALREGRAPRVPLAAAAALLAVLWPVLVLWDPPAPVANPVLAVPFAALILAAATADSRSLVSPLRGRALVYAGEISFAFYLVHEQVLLHVRDRVADPAATAALALLLSVAAAAALHAAVERPCRRLVMRRVARRRPEPRDDAAPEPVAA